MFSIQSVKQIIKHIEDIFYKYPSFDMSVLETQLQDLEDIRKCKQHDGNNGYNGGQQSGKKIQVCNLRTLQQEQQKLSKYKCEDKEQMKLENQQKQNFIGYKIANTKLADQSILDFTQPNIWKTSNIFKNKSFLNNQQSSIATQTQQQIPNKTHKEKQTQTKKTKWSTKTIKHKLTTVLNQYIIKNVNITKYKIKQTLDNYGIGNDYSELQQNSQIQNNKENQLDDNGSLYSLRQIQDSIVLRQDEKQKIKDQNKSQHVQDVCCIREQQCLSNIEHFSYGMHNSIN